MGNALFIMKFDMLIRIKREIMKKLIPVLMLFAAVLMPLACAKPFGSPASPIPPTATPTFTSTSTPEWHTLGSAAVTTGPVTFFSFAVANSTPVIAATNEYTSGAFATAYYGGYWNIQGSLTGKWTMAKPSLVMNGSTPCVAFSDATDSNMASVLSYNGTSWTYVGGAGFSPGIVSGLSLTAYNGTLYLAYSDAVNGGEAAVMTYNGTGWVNVGSADFSVGGADWISLAVSSGTPYVAFGDAVNGYKATVMSYSGGVWSNVGAADFSAGMALGTSLVVNNGMPYVAFSDAGNGYKAAVMAYSGGTWSHLGSTGLSISSTYGTDLVLSNNTLYLSYADDGNGDNVTVCLLYTSPSP